MVKAPKMHGGTRGYPAYCGRVVKAEWITTDDKAVTCEKCLYMMT